MDGFPSISAPSGRLFSGAVLFAHGRQQRRDGVVIPG